VLRNQALAKGSGADGVIGGVMDGSRDREESYPVFWQAYCVFATVHVLLCGYEAYRNSPTRNELAHLAAGVSHLAFQRFDLYRVNPPLVRSVAALPVVLASPKTDWTAYTFEPTDRREDRVGGRFAELNGHRFPFLMILARWACIPFSLVGGWVCGRWAMRLYGIPSGILAMTLWFFSPMVTGHALLITPDAHAAALAICATYCIWNWLNQPRWEKVFGTGLVLGLAELTKFTLLVLYPVIVSLWVMYWLRGSLRGEADQTRPPSERPAFRQLIVLLLLSVLTINLGYAFEGTFRTLGDYRFQSRLFTGLPKDHSSSPPHGQKSRFADTFLDSLPIPLPVNYVQGIDTQRLDFERGIGPSYLFGTWQQRGWWYWYLYALLLKTPLGTLTLLGLTIFVTVSCSWAKRPWRDELTVLLPAIGVFLLVSSQTGFTIHLRYTLPAFPFLFIWASKVARVFELRCFTRKRLALATMVIVAIIWSVASSLSIYPHSLSYFNELAAVLPTSADATYPKPISKSGEDRGLLWRIGYLLTAGPRNGPRHLLDSNIDWGQDLFYLKDWLDKHPDVKLDGLACYGSYPATLAGIPETPMPPTSPASEPERMGHSDSTAEGGGAADQSGPDPGWYALSVNYIYGRDRQYRYFLNFEPVAMAGYSIHIYHITWEEANQVRRELGMPELRQAAETDKAQAP
jgi:hypothetical protein